jgi:Mycothiol maleylpyruvate isomerase N-terminal domain
LPPKADPDARQRRDAAIAERGRSSGAALGDDPAAAVKKLSRRVTALVNASPEDAPLATPMGMMTLAGYLPTRTFELTVHSLDLARALHRTAPASLKPAITASCELAGSLAGQLPAAPELLLLLSGRGGLPQGVSVV